MSSIGEYFRVTTYGESHGRSVGCIVDGVPPGLKLDEADIEAQLRRRRPGQSVLNSPRGEKDRVEIQSGTEFGVTLGSPVCLRVCNEDKRPQDYRDEEVSRFPRPSHADWTYLQKYGVKASSGGGRSSARETVGRVAAGVIAEKFLSEAYGIEIVAFVSSVGDEHLYGSRDSQTPDSGTDFEDLVETITREEVDTFAPVRCPHAESAQRMAKVISDHRDRLDSIGGSITCVIRNAPAGLGEPAFHKLEATLSFAMMSIPATKGFEIGSGFDGSAVPGSRHNDAFVAISDDDDENPRSRSTLFASPDLKTKTNNSGGVQGGISNGAPVYFRVAFKSPATIGKPQRTTAFDKQEGQLEVRGRHDPCVVPRAVPIVESMAAIVLMDAMLAQQARLSARALLPPAEQSQAALKELEELTINEKCKQKLLNVRWRNKNGVICGRSGNDRVENGERYRAKP